MAGEPPQPPTAPPSAPPQAREPGYLSKEERDHVERWVVQKWGNGDTNALPACPMCKVDGPTWIGPWTMYTPMAMEDRSIFHGGPIMPLLPVMCSNCGNTVFVNAITAGVLSPTGEKLIKPEAEKPNG